MFTERALEGGDANVNIWADVYTLSVFPLSSSSSSSSCPNSLNIAATKNGNKVHVQIFLERMRNISCLKWFSRFNKNIFIFILLISKAPNRVFIWAVACYDTFEHLDSFIITITFLSMVKIKITFPSVCHVTGSAMLFIALIDCRVSVLLGTDCMYKENVSYTIWETPPCQVPCWWLHCKRSVWLPGTDCTYVLLKL